MVSVYFYFREHFNYSYNAAEAIDFNCHKSMSDMPGSCRYVVIEHRITEALYSLCHGERLPQ